MGSLVNSTKHLRKKLYQFQRIEAEKITSNSFFEGSIVCVTPMLLIYPSLSFPFSSYKFVFYVCESVSVLYPYCFTWQCFVLFYGRVMVHCVCVCVCVCMYTHLFIHTYTHTHIHILILHLLKPVICYGHLGSFQGLAIVNSASMNIGMHVFLN